MVYRPEWDSKELSNEARRESLDWQIQNGIKNPVRLFETLELISSRETSQEMVDYEAWNKQLRSLRTFSLDEISYYNEIAKDKLNKTAKSYGLGETMPNNHLGFNLEELNNLIFQVNKEADKSRCLGRRFGSKRRPIIIPFVMFKGGVAKTTNAINASVYYSLRGLKVLIIDFDSQASASYFWGIRSSYDVPDPLNNTIFRVLTENPASRAWESLKPLKTHWSNIDILPSHSNISMVEVAAAENVKQSNYSFNDIYNLKTALENGAFDNYDIVIVDTPPQFNRATVGITWASEIMAIPNFPNALTAHTQELLWGFLKENYEKTLRIDSNNKPLLRALAIIPNIVNSKMTYGVSEDVDRLYRTHKGNDFSFVNKDNIIKRLLVVSDASAIYKTVFEATAKDGLSNASLRKARKMFKDAFDVTLTKSLERIWDNQDKT